jgi:hypothetical protein
MKKVSLILSSLLVAGQPLVVKAEESSSCQPNGIVSYALCVAVEIASLPTLMLGGTTVGIVLSSETTKDQQKSNLQSAQKEANVYLAQKEDGEVVDIKNFSRLNAMVTAMQNKAATDAQGITQDEAVHAIAMLEVQ